MFCFVASNLLRLSYQGSASCSVLVDENGGTSDSLATPKSPNHTKTSENTGRLCPQDPAESPRARSKRSLEPLDLLDGGGVGIDRVGMKTVHDDPPENRLISRTLNARTNNNALPQQMYDAMMVMAAKRNPLSRTLASSIPRRHRKRQTAADVVVYRKESDDGGYGEIVDEAVNIVPLDSEHRIRVNLTIASDGSAGSPMYSVSLSLPSVEQQPKPEIVPSDRTTALVQPPSLSAGTECECFCPCLEQDDEQVRPFDAEYSSTISPSTSIPMGNETSSAYWITSSTTSESPETSEVSCPPPVLMFCDTGK